MIALLRFISLGLAWLCAILGTACGDLCLAGVASGLACAIMFNVFKCDANKKV